MATWAEIKELAGKLKTTQEKTSLQYLSERTWVDIVRHLISIDRLKLIYTTDGRSYLTMDELEKEIREEVEVHGGRITIAEITTNLDVEYSIIESRVNDMLASYSDDPTEDKLISIPGELISMKYVRQLTHDIQDRLESRGRASVGELATVFGLPTSFLSSIIDQYQGTLFSVHKYGEAYLTDSFVNENKSKVRGYLSAVMRPITLSALSSKLNMPDSLLTSIVNNLFGSGQLNGTLQANRGTYVPQCYLRAEDDYVRAFFLQNGYVEWNYLKRLGILDPATYLRTLLPNAVHLSGVSIGPMIMDQIKANVEEVEREGSWADLTHCLPIGLTGKDRLALVTRVASGHHTIKLLSEGSYIVADAFIQKCEAHFSVTIFERAELASKVQRSNLVHQMKPDQTQPEQQTKKVTQSNKGGFGMGAREIKTKNVKKKYVPGKRRSGANADSVHNDTHLDNDFGTASTESVFQSYISVDELCDILASELPSDVPESVVEGIVSQLIPGLESAFNNSVNSIFIPNTTSSKRRETTAKVQETVNNLIFSIQLMNRGIDGVKKVSLNVQLFKYLMKKHGVQVADLLCAHLSQYYDIQNPHADAILDSIHNSQQMDPAAALTVDDRRQIIESLQHVGTAETSEAASALQSLMDQLRAAQAAQCSLSEFLTAVQKLAVDHMGLTLQTLQMRTDNKRKREERNKSNELALQMELQMVDAYDKLSTNDALMTHATTVSLGAACLFGQFVTGWPIVAPGKCVPELVDWLMEVGTEETSETGERSAAYKYLFSSSAVDDLSELVNQISASMHDQANELSLQKVKLLIEKLIDTIKTCRKNLYT